MKKKYIIIPGLLLISIHFFIFLSVNLVLLLKMKEYHRNK
jgi:hypothetical protein